MIFLFIITLAYLILMFSFLIGFRKVKSFEKRNDNSKLFSIIIPFRNEEKKLNNLLDALAELDYPKNQFEVLFVDDDSDDNSIGIINSKLKKSDINYQILQNKRLSNSPKKDAITTAISHATNPWILTTDADCRLTKHWLSSFSSFLNADKEVKMVVAPVILESKNNLIQQFQLTENLSLQTITCGAFGVGFPFLSNGANLCYQKETFENLKGFENNNQIASGDDIFLLETFVKKGKKVSYLKSHYAIVNTDAENSWQEVIQQRTRWARKSKYYSLKISKISGLVVLAMNLGLMTLFAETIVHKFKLIPFLLILGIKLILDFILARSSAKLFGIPFNKPLFFINGFLYPFLSSWIGFKSIFTGYRWKGREFKN